MEYPVIIALDFPNKEETRTFLKKFSDENLFVKVGMELFYQEGPEVIKEIKAYGHKIFLDLKLHDIPNTVYRTMKRLACLDVDLVNVHAAGGSEMMKAAIEGLAENSRGERPKCIAVTQLTSTSEDQMRREQLIEKRLIDSVYHYAKLAKDSGLDGIVSSVHEAKLIRSIDEDLIIITPGIRLACDQDGDQKRVADPRFARLQGATGIVVGRSITNKKDPYQAYLTVKKEWELVES
ncbi:orotidine-5'-phosphate decarboxylase [Caldibacillus thermolactis]|jgi:orotidine-5'-phosphate decarboxylase|uniref:Orotidine 5'-phosphate decarboxylase n=1 Tax=Pallidibacillus thermolactis TaxID=251051 RepID=A0ABT2WBT5_9BACI|nr:orotidine-5'-phosphate decarboxylase [Pallidibacillus thermolactis]MCU9593151.1 orotidine-5'-phosphate decarboxylase [Pallidibacillus thermolactis]MCU9600085.1 orotidine-5'-phosphate decarboxylase [Pallidibacillus thermolactis subsp. kokeshiiformis]MED1672178.1 orotidine-5'-phosphate decarboxylase [Pallidibacillus thermolactis subsp. kokeshiiformis]